MDWISLAVSLGALATQYFVSRKQNQRAEDAATTAYDRQRALLKDTALLNQEGYEQAGINPYVSEGNLISAPSVEQAEVFAQDPSQSLSQIGSLIGSLSQKEVNDTRKLEIEANKNLLLDMGVKTKAEAKLIATQNADLEDHRKTFKERLEALQLQNRKTRADIGFVEQQTATSVAEEKNIIGDTQLKEAQTDNEKARKAQIIYDGKISKYNFDQILPRTAKALQFQLNFSEDTYMDVLQQIKNATALSANSLSQSNINLTVLEKTWCQQVDAILAKYGREIDEDKAKQIKAQLEGMKLKNKKFAQEHSWLYSPSDQEPVGSSMRGAVMIFELIMQDLADCLPVGKMLGIDKIASSGE